MGQAKAKRDQRLGYVENAQTLPRKMFAIKFRKPHRLAGQVLRRGRGPAIAFTMNEARAMLATMIEEKRITLDNIPNVEIVPIVVDDLPDAEAVTFTPAVIETVEPAGGSDAAE